MDVQIYLDYFGSEIFEYVKLFFVLEFEMDIVMCHHIIYRVVLATLSFKHSL